MKITNYNPFKGNITLKDGIFYIQTKDDSLTQKIYLVSVYTQPHEVDRSKEYEFVLIPNNSESDEQVEYIARILNF